jgi:hypothetical protein
MSRIDDIIRGLYFRKSKQEKLLQALARIEQAVVRIEQGMPRALEGLARVESALVSQPNEFSRYEERVTARLEAERQGGEQAVARIESEIAQIESRIGRIESETGRIESKIGQVASEVGRSVSDELEKFFEKRIRPLVAATPQQSYTRMGWDAIHGYFEFDDIYDEAVRTCPQGATIVEVGVYFGRSLAYLAEVAAKDRPDIQIYGVDPWVVTDKINSEGWGGWDEDVGGDPETLVQNKIRKAGGPFNYALSQLREHAPMALERCKLLRLTSTQAARIFDIGSIHMAFLDGDHRFEAVREDCLAWWPRISSGGFLAGHDWPNYESVRNAVSDFAGRQSPPLQVSLSRKSWMVRK